VNSLFTTARVHTRTCPVCSGSQKVDLYRPGASPGLVSRCAHCGMVFVSQIDDDQSLIFEGAKLDGHDVHLLTSANLDDICNFWEYRYILEREAEADALHDNAQQFLDIVEPFLPQIAQGADRGNGPHSVLDFGSGWGFFLSAAQTRGWDAYGLEPLPASSIYARAKFGLKIKTDTLRVDSFAPESFDLITAFQVFEHLPYPDSDVQKLRTFLKQHGLILIEVPNHNTWTMKLLGHRHRHYVADHLNFFSPATLLDFVTRNGFEAMKVWTTTRQMSVRHLISRWTGRLLPSSAHLSEGLARRLGIWDKTIGVNIGDIVAVLARKV